MPKLIPFPAMIDTRKPVITLRWPIASRVSPKVKVSPVNIVTAIGTSTRNRR